LVQRTADPALGAVEAFALLTAVRDWPRLVQLATREMAPLALWRAIKGMPESVPAEALSTLQQGAVQLDLRMQQLARRAQQTTRAFAEAGVPCLLLKGAAVGAIVDPTFRARPMSDIDVLVHRNDVERAKAAVLTAGWNLTDNPVYLEMLQDAHHLPHFVDPTLPGMRLELHVMLMPDDQPFGFDETLLWRDARPAPPPFDGALVPSSEHMLLHACVHFAWQHTVAFGAWRTFRVVSAMLAQPDFNWERFTDTALAVKAGTTCFWTLRLAQTMAGIPVPERVLARLAPPTPDIICRALERHFIAQIAPGEGPVSPSIKLTRLLWRMALRPDWSGHANPGRYDPEQKWAKAYGTASTETRAQRWMRHARGIGEWTRFASKTLFR
jgi:hypothetical protein